MDISEVGKDIADTLQEIKKFKRIIELNPRMRIGYEGLIKKREELLIIMNNKLKELQNGIS